MAFWDKRVEELRKILEEVSDSTLDNMAGSKHYTDNQRDAIKAEQERRAQDS